MYLCCKWGGKLGNQPLKITKWGHFKDSKWSRPKIEIFRRARDFFGRLNGTRDSEGHFGANKDIVKSTLFRKALCPLQWHKYTYSPWTLK